jgi:hypothetical protein
MTTNYNIDRTKQVINGFGLPFCDTIYSATLVANADTTVAVPLKAAMGAPTANTYNKFYAVIACTPAKDTYIALNATAAVPVGGTFAAVSSELIPQGYIIKMVKSGDTLHFISGTTPNVTVAFYAIQE